MPLAREDLVPLLLAAPVVVLCGWWSLAEGGYDPTRWMPGAVVVAVLVAVSVWAARGQMRFPSRTAMLAAAALAGYVAWSFVTVLWADSPGAALEGSQRSLLYLMCFVLFVLLPWTPRAALIALGAFVAVVTGVGIVTLLRLTGLQDPTVLLVNARLSAPLGYQNATAALWTMAAIPALGLAVRGDIAWFLRGPLLAGCGLLVGMALLTQSRGWLVTLPLLVIATFVVHPERWRLLLGMMLVAGSVLAASGALLAPYAVGGSLASADSVGLLRAAFDDVAASLWLVIAGLLVLGTALAVLERVMRPSRPTDWLRRASRPLGLALLAGVVIAGGIVALAATDGRPLQRVDSAWTEFQDFEGPADGATTNRFTGLGSSRYDFWRVAVGAWREHPVGGLGQDNFAQAYQVDRRSEFEEPRWVHSLPLRLLTHTGLVGAALFGLFVLAALWAANPRRRSRPGSQSWRVAAAVALLPGAVWLVHGSVDWLWEFPALSVPAVAFLGVAAAVARDTETDAVPAGPPSRLAVGVGVAALLSLLVIVPGYLSARDVSWASAHWRADPAQAFGRLARARSLNPLGQRASLAEGLIAIRSGDAARAQRAFTMAAEREPLDWFSRFELGLLASARGDRRTARRQFAAARARNPRDTLVAEALSRVGSPRPMTFSEADRVFAQRVARRTGR